MSSLRQPFVRVASLIAPKFHPKFHQNRLRRVSDITKTFWSLFSGHSVLCFIMPHEHIEKQIKWVLYELNECCNL